MHICVGNLTIIGSDNGLSPGRRQAITWTNVGILLIGPLGTNFGEMLIAIHTFSFKKIHLKMSSGKWRPFFSRPQCVNSSHADLNPGIRYTINICPFIKKSQQRESSSRHYTCISVWIACSVNISFLLLFLLLFSLYISIYNGNGW